MIARIQILLMKLMFGNRAVMWNAVVDLDKSKLTIRPQKHGEALLNVKDAELIALNKVTMFGAGITDSMQYNGLHLSNFNKIREIKSIEKNEKT